VLQRVFIGGHADVGGGYKEKGLSDITLGWMITQLSKHQLLAMSPVLFTVDYNAKLHPNYKAPAHQELKQLANYTRLFKLSSQIEAHSSIEDRKKLSSVVHADGEAPKKYNPANWPPT